MRRRLMLKSRAGVSPVLPAEYQQVEYIESDGYQYIDTGVYANGTTKIHVKFRANTIANLSTSGGSAIYSASNTYNNKNRDVFTSGNGKLFVGYANQYTQNFDAGINSTDIFTLDNPSANVFIAKNLTTGTEQTQSFIAESFTTPYTIHLFALWRGNFDISYKGTGCCIYEYEHRDNDTLIQQMIPCYRKSDGVIGMYDTVSQAFFTNAGTGTFTKGADV